MTTATATPSIGEQIQRHRTAAAAESWAVVRRLVNERELSPADVGALSDALNVLGIKPPPTATVTWADFAEKWLGSMRQILETHATCGRALKAEPALLDAVRKARIELSAASDTRLAAMTKESAAAEKHHLAESALTRVTNQRNSMKAFEARYPGLFSDADDASEGDDA